MAVDVESRELVSAVGGDAPLTSKDVINQSLVVQRILKEVFVEGVHYGKIPGTPKDTLYQPGAEKICVTFRLAPKYAVEDLSDPENNFFRYRTTCSLYTIRDGLFVGSAVGECSTAEEKYQWRRAVCDEEYDEADPQNRRIKWYKPDRQGEAASSVKQVRTNAADLANTALKIADKRSFISAARGAVGASDIFDVDLEDNEHVAELAREDGARTKPKARAKTPPAPEIRYGPSKGKRVNDPAVPVSHLQDILEGKRKELANPNREQKWDAGNKTMIAAIEAELKRRGAAESKEEPPKEPDQPTSTEQSNVNIVNDAEWIEMLGVMTDQHMKEYTKTMQEFGVKTADAVKPEDRQRFFEKVRNRPREK